MELIEPQTVFVRRYSPAFATASPAPLRPQQRPRQVIEEFWTSLVFAAIADRREPVRITTVVNEVARQGNYTRRADYDRKRVDLFRLLGRLIRIGRIDRVARKYVAIPKTDERYRAYQEMATRPFDLPQPDV